MTKTHNTRQDDQLTVLEYWAKYKQAIADTRKLTRKTLEAYDKLMNKLAPELPDKPISQLSEWELSMAMERARGRKERGGRYYKSTQKFFSILSDIYRYAEAHGHACNILIPLRNSQKAVIAQERTLYEQVFDTSLPLAKRKALLERLLEQEPYHVRSLRREALHRLIIQLSKHILDDGRYCGLAIMLYCGTRPSECRALLWGDLVPFRDHPERRMLVLSKTLDPQGKVRERMKTSNAYRRIPVQRELEALLKQRYDHVKGHLPAGVDMDQLPICCFQNDFSRPCQEFQLIQTGKEVMQKIGLTAEDYAFFYADTIINPSVGKGEISFHLYILRRNFYSWLYGLSQLDPLERAYLMGHSMVVGQEDLRPSYNSEDALFRMLEGMDRAMLNPDRLRPPYIQTLRPGNPVRAENQGVMVVAIPAQYLTRRCEIRLSLLAQEADSHITISAHSPVRPFGGLRVEGERISHPPSRRMPPISMDTQNLYAWTRFKAEKLLDSLSWEEWVEQYLKEE